MSADDTARIWAHNLALGLPAHGMPFVHRAISDIACPTCFEPAMIGCRHSQPAPVDLIVRRALGACNGRTA